MAAEGLKSHSISSISSDPDGEVSGGHHAEFDILVDPCFLSIIKSSVLENSAVKIRGIIKVRSREHEVSP